MPSEAQPRPERTAYVLKVYPRFSETFVVTEILAREAAGEDLAIYALRPTSDSRFHPQLAQVQAPVTHLPRSHRVSGEWASFARAHAQLPDFGARLGELMPLLVRLDPTATAQAVELALALRRDGITRMHVHFATLASWCAAVASALTGIPYTVTTHAKDIFHQDLDPVLLREILHRAEKVVAISEYNRQHLLTTVDPTLDDKVVLVRNGLDLPRFTYRDPRPPQAALHVLAVGRVVEKKGFEHLVEAARQLHAQGMPLQVRVVGEGERLAAVRQQVVEAGLDGVVSLLGSRSQAELVDELDWADVLAAPCVVGADGNADGLPTVLLEAMASGVPCVATDVTGIPEAVHPVRGEDPATGILLSRDPAGLPGRLADALRQVADPGWPRVEVARAARALIERDFDTVRQVGRLAHLARAEEAHR